MSKKREMTEETAIKLLEEIRDGKILVEDLYWDSVKALFNMAIDGIRKQMLLKEMQKEISSEVEALSMDSPFVFSDDEHGACINTENALNLMLSALDRQKRELEHRQISASGKNPKDDDAVSRKEVEKLLQCIPSEEGITKAFLLHSLANMPPVTAKIEGKR
jgi:hypothetical protein